MYLIHSDNSEYIVVNYETCSNMFKPYVPERAAYFFYESILLCNIRQMYDP